MITLPGQLAIKTVNGRNGPFNVGKLSTSIGDFTVKDAMLDQFAEGKYDGDFVVANISPSYYQHAGRLVVEVKARLEGMTLTEANQLSSTETELMEPKEPDPIDTETPAVTASTRKPSTAASPDSDLAPFGMTPTELSSEGSEVQTGETDEELFGVLWPLTHQFKLDTTVDRQTLRSQKKRLEELGYKFDHRTQYWARSR